MKSEYIIYGRRNKELERNLSEKEKRILEEYLAFCSMTASPDKVQDYRRYMLQFMDVVEKPLDKLEQSDAIRFWALVNHSPHEEATKITIRRTVKRFLNWFYRDPEMTKPLRNRDFRVNEKKINQSALLKLEELEAMLRAVETLRDKALLVLLYESAARPQELRELRWQDVNWNKEEVHFYSRKKKKARDIPVKHALLHLKRWKQEFCFLDVREDDYIFPSHRGGASDRSKPISVTYIDRIVSRTAIRAGIKRRIYPYLFRHSRLTEIHRLGVKGAEHNLFAGHEIGSRQLGTYVHLNNEDMKRTVLDCVYNVKEVKQREDEYERRISELKEKQEELQRQLEEVLPILKSAHERLEEAKTKRGVQLLAG